ncbi:MULTISPECIES: KGK domain-containing protein [unclassified Microcoleus]|uniref:KGK domain-containing protein n=1 Tax=unclassified Microcoleus TaxID=2642155 RepID=UPI002FD26DA1
MNAKFKNLDGETDILLIHKDTFTVNRFKELMSNKLAERLNKRHDGSRKGNPIFFDLFFDFSMGGVNVSVFESKWIFPSQGIDCQLLKIGSQGWQKGKLRIEASLSVATSTGYCTIEVIKLEFCPDEPAQPESILDDIRQSEEYKNLTNNT